MTLPDLLAARLRADPASPLVTFYDDATGERTELSSATFDNWVAKTANLLVDGLGLGPGDIAAVVLPLHWQSLAVVAGCWSAGLIVRLTHPSRSAPAQGVPAHVGFSAEGGPRPDADEVGVLSLRPLGVGLATPDASVIDFAAEVRAYGDRFAGPFPDGADEALPGVTHAELAGAPGSAARTLLAPDGDPMLDEDWLRRAYVDPLAGGGSVVLCRHADPTKLERRRATEHAV